jgi:hypothetical protein
MKTYVFFGEFRNQFLKGFRLADPAISAVNVFAGSLLRPFPDQCPVSIDLPYPMKWNLQRLTHLIFQFKRESISRLEVDFPERDTNDPLLHMIQVPDLKRTC